MDTRYVISQTKNIVAVIRIELQTFIVLLINICLLLSVWESGTASLCTASSRHIADIHYTQNMRLKLICQFHSKARFAKGDTATHFSGCTPLFFPPNTRNHEAATQPLQKATPTDFVCSDERKICSILQLRDEVSIDWKLGLKASII